MNIVNLILGVCTEDEKELISPSLRRFEAPVILPDDNPFAQVLKKSMQKEERHYERRVEAYMRHFGLDEDNLEDRHQAWQMTGEGWWERRQCGPVPFQDVPEYRFRSQDMQVSDELSAKDKRAEKREALNARQATWNRVQRSMKRNWSGALTRDLKSG